MDSSTQTSAAAQRVARQYGSLEQSIGWLLTALQTDAGSPPLASDDLAERLQHLVTQMDEGQGRLGAFAHRFQGLRAERQQVGTEDELSDFAFRCEQAASEALALYVECQAASAARAAQLTASLPDEIDFEARQQHLARIGASVRATLDANPAAEKLPTKSLELYIVREFIDAEEADGLIALIDRDLYPSGLLADHPDKEYRTSKSCNLSRADRLVDIVDGRIAKLIGVDRRFSETVQGQRYEIGQQFKPHHDFFHKGEGYYDHVQRQGGQRSWTAMLFLNKPEAGGHTNFPEAGVEVRPERGALLLWNNIALDGTPNHNSLHQGMPVEAGIKYVITKWFRERPWG